MSDCDGQRGRENRNAFPAHRMYECLLQIVSISDIIKLAGGSRDGLLPRVRFLELSDGRRFCCLIGMGKEDERNVPSPARSDQ